MGRHEIAPEPLPSERLIEVSLAGIGLPVHPFGGIVVEDHRTLHGDPAREVLRGSPKIDEIDDVGKFASQPPLVERGRRPDREVDVGVRSRRSGRTAAEHEREGHAVSPQGRPQRIEVERQVDAVDVATRRTTPGSTGQATTPCDDPRVKCRGVVCEASVSTVISSAVS